jgi:hypothetical protein
LVKESILLLDILRLVPATSPAVSPVAHQEFEAENIDLHARLKADAEVPEVHLVLVRMRKQKTEVTCDREQQIVIERGQVRKLVDQHLWHGLGSGAFARNLLLGRLGEQFVW